MVISKVPASWKKHYYNDPKLPEKIQHLAMCLEHKPVYITEDNNYAIRMCCQEHEHIFLLVKTR